MRLNDLEVVRNTGRKAVPRLRQRLVGEIDIAPCHGYEFGRGFQIVEGGAHRGVDLAAEVGQFRLALRELRVRLQLIGPHLGALKDRYVQSGLESERSVRSPEIGAADVSVVRVCGKVGIVLGRSRC